MRRRVKIGVIRRFLLALTLFDVALVATLISANGQVDRTSPRDRPGFHGHPISAQPSRSPLATGDSRPIDSDRDGADHPADEPETVFRPRHIQDCVESSRNDPRWNEKRALTEPHCAER
jgi:hypothetical protein